MSKILTVGINSQKHATRSYECKTKYRNEKNCLSNAVQSLYFIQTAKFWQNWKFYGIQLTIDLTSCGWHYDFLIAMYEKIRGCYMRNLKTLKQMLQAYTYTHTHTHTHTHKVYIK